MSIFDAGDLFGPLLVGAYLNLMLYTVECFLIIQYYRSKDKIRTDGIFLQSVIAFAFINDTVGTSVTCAEVYIYVVSCWGNFWCLLKPNWIVGTYFISGVISDTLVQMWYIVRYHRISKHCIVTLLLFLAVLVSDAAQIAVVCTIAIPKSDTWNGLKKFITIGLVSNAAANIGIAAALIWELRRVKPVFRSTKALVRKVSMHAIQTGTATSAVAVVVAILYLQNPSGTAAGCVHFLLARVYTCSMLYSLNNRVRLRKDIGVHVSDLNMDLVESSDSTSDSQQSFNRSNHCEDGSIPRCPSIPIANSTSLRGVSVCSISPTTEVPLLDMDGSKSITDCPHSK